MADFDLAVIGGGINGAGIARDAAGRGIKVLLIEQNDLASGTSSASTKLIHGGLRYLEQGAFRLVREALAEREVLLRNAPHLIRPLRFVLPHDRALRPAWLLRAGLFVYDRLAGRRILGGSRVIDLAASEIGAPLKPGFRTGFEYSDARVDDARLVVLNAVDAAERGASIRTRTCLVGAMRDEGVWRLRLETEDEVEKATSRVLVNASGPWVIDVAQHVLHDDPEIPVRLVKGSHIIVRQLFDHDRAYIFQGGDGRVIFAIPYERRYTLIGTTDQEYDDDPAYAAATQDEIEYLCRCASSYFREPLTSEQVIWSYAGVRPLVGAPDAKPQDLSRDYSLLLEVPYREAPLLTVYGGKITTYRRLAEEALAKLGSFFREARGAWTQGTPLPGGDFAWNAFDALVQHARSRWPFLSEPHARRLVGAYGTRIEHIFGGHKTAEEVGPWFGEELSAAEVRHLMRNEWAASPEDVLWRRSKLGLHLGREGREVLERFMMAERGLDAAAE
jgi:glycerol-3-phosphate dehydrogenase